MKQMNIYLSIAAVSRKSSFATVVKFFNMVYTFRSIKNQKQESIVLKNFTTVAKLLSLLNAANICRKYLKNCGQEHCLA